MVIVGGSGKTPEDSDGTLLASLDDAAYRLAGANGGHQQAIDELRAMAGDRRYLLQESAGWMIGDWMAARQRSGAIVMYAAALLLASSA